MTTRPDFTPEQWLEIEANMLATAMVERFADLTEATIRQEDIVNSAN